MGEPEPAERPRELQLSIGVVRTEPVERDAEVVVVLFEATRPLRLRVHVVCVALVGERREERCVAAPELVRLAGLVEALSRVLADGLEHEEPVVAHRLEQAEIDQRSERIDVRFGDLLRRRQREAPGEDREAREEPFGALVEQVVAPLDGRPERALPLRRVARALGEQGERRVETPKERLGREQLRSRGGELDGEGKPVEPAADRADGLVGQELAPDPPRSLDEERARVGRRERVEWVLDLRRDPQRRAARREHA